MNNVFALIILSQGSLSIRFNGMAKIKVLQLTEEQRLELE